jgi:hypothetical protein
MEPPERAPDTRELVTCERCGGSTGPMRIGSDNPQWCLRCQLEWTIRGCEDLQAEARAAQIEAREARANPRLPAGRPASAAGSAFDAR